MSQDRTSPDNEGTSPNPVVTRIMNGDVPAVSPDASVALVSKMMITYDVEGVAVVEDDNIIGIITHSDIIARQADVETPTPVPWLDAIFVADAGRMYEDEVRRALAINARMLMSAPVISIRSGATLNDVASVMLDREVHPLPVVDVDGRYLGIVSRKDLVRVIADMENQDV